MPNHPESDIPMNFYLPPPILHNAKAEGGGVFDPESMEFFTSIDKMRVRKVPGQHARRQRAGSARVTATDGRLHAQQRPAISVTRPKSPFHLGLTYNAMDIKAASLGTFQERFVIPERTGDDDDLDPRNHEKNIP
jgi:hypothetical protein